MTDQLRYQSFAATKAACLSLLVVFSIGAVSAEPTVVKTCAAEDLRLVIAIEEHGDAGTVSSKNLAGAYSSLLEARAAGRTGDIAQALRMYSDISLRSQEASAAPQ